MFENILKFNTYYYTVSNFSTNYTNNYIKFDIQKNMSYSFKTKTQKDYENTSVRFLYNV